MTTPLEPASRLWAIRQGGALVERTQAGFLLATPAKRTHTYANAQLDDTAGLRRSAFFHKPPLRLRLRARFSHAAADLRGTAGFGFWNDPFGMSGTWPPALPQAAWFFFASPPSNIALAAGVPGFGFKAATLHAGRWQARLLAPLTVPLAAALNLPGVHRRLWPPLQRAAGIAERLLPPDLRAWNTYALEWRRDGVCFLVNDEPVLATPVAPTGPLGLVIWIDNQYLVATPQGRLAWGLTASAAPQWLEIADLSLEQP